MRPTRRSVLAAAGALGMSSFLASCDAIRPTSAEYVMTASHTLSTTHFQHHALEEFKRLIEERSDGRMELRIFPNAVLGSDLEAMRAVQFESIHMAIVATSPMASYLRQFYTLDLPYIFETPEHAYAVLDGPYGDQLMTELADARLLGLGWWELGFRHLSTNGAPVTEPDQLQGMRIRTMESQALLQAWRATGANPTPIAFDELYTALQQGTIDAQENPYTLFTDRRFYEVQQSVTETSHLYSPGPLVMSRTYFDNLPTNLQDILLEAGQEATQFNREASIQAALDAADLVRENGVEITELTDEQREEFQTVMQDGAIPYVRRVVGDERVDFLFESLEDAL